MPMHPVNRLHACEELSALKPVSKVLSAKGNSGGHSAQCVIKNTEEDGITIAEIFCLHSGVYGKLVK